MLPLCFLYASSMLDATDLGSVISRMRIAHNDLLDVEAKRARNQLP